MPRQGNTAPSLPRSRHPRQKAWEEETPPLSSSAPASLQEDDGQHLPPTAHPPPGSRGTKGAATLNLVFPGVGGSFTSRRVAVAAAGERGACGRPTQAPSLPFAHSPAPGRGLAPFLPLLPSEPAWRTGGRADGAARRGRHRPRRLLHKASGREGALDVAIWLYQFRLIVLGDLMVGKFCLLHRFAEGRFPGPAKTDPTVGVEFYSRLVEIEPGKRIKLLLWDTARQERFSCRMPPRI